jgi:hypothetical protein
MTIKMRALVAPRKGTRDEAGACLRFAQSFFGAPVAHRSAWHAWLAQPRRNGPEVPLPNVPVILWFSHWGRYDDRRGQYGDNPRDPYYGNWGHVTPYVPGDAIYSSPANGYGQGRYANTTQIEQTFNSKYVGWTDSINGLRIAEPDEEAVQLFLEEQMTNPIINVVPRNALMVGRNDGKFEEYATPRSMNSRGIISVAFFGAKKGDEDSIPSLSVGDFEVVKTVWAQMCKGNGPTTAAQIDVELVQSAASKGARDALSGLVLKSSP